MRDVHEWIAFHKEHTINPAYKLLGWEISTPKKLREIVDGVGDDDEVLAITFTLDEQKVSTELKQEIQSCISWPTVTYITLQEEVLKELWKDIDLD